MTSTKDKDKGVLVDIFDGGGIFRDSFFLKLPEPAAKQLGWPGRCTLDGDFLWIAESDDDDVFTIKKFRLDI